jgi:hypothetical protein
MNTEAAASNTHRSRRDRFPPTCRCHGPRERQLRACLVVRWSVACAQPKSGYNMSGAEFCYVWCRPFAALKWAEVTKSAEDLEFLSQDGRPPPVGLLIQLNKYN